MGELREIVIHTFHDNHSLFVLVDSQSLVFHTFCCDIDLRELTNLCQNRVIARRSLSHRRHNFKLRIETRKEGSHQIMESIEYTQHDNQCHGCYGNTNRRNSTDDIDGMSTFL